MSNPSVCFLSSVEIGSVNFRVEDNLGEAIHIHLGRVRLAMTINEFFVIAEGIINAVNKLLKIQNFKFAEFDMESLKKDWVDYYENIYSAHVEYVALDTLYMKESYVKNRAIKRIIPLEESGYIKVLKGERSDIDYYNMPGKFEPSRKQKMDYIKRKIEEEEGYPLECKLILVDQESYIYDGVKRASCLYYLYGGRKEVPILRISLPRDKSIKEQQLDAENKIQNWNAKKIEDNNNFKGGTKKCCFEKKSELKKLGIKEFVNKLSETGIPFYVINKKKKNEKGMIIADVIVIVAEGELEKIQEKLNITQIQSSLYDNYRFLYTARKPLQYITNEGSILIFDKISCKNLFENDIIPADKYILKRSWMQKKWNEKWKCYFAGDDIYLLIVIMDALFEKRCFEQEDIELIESHKEILHQLEFKKMLEKEFYQYSGELINYLIQQQYNYAVEMYLQFTDY